MATREKARPTEGEIISADEAHELVQLGGGDTPDDLAQTPAERMAAMLELASGIDRAKVAVYRMSDDKPGQMDFANNYTLEEFEAGGDLNLIRRQFGAGRYSVRIFGTLARSGKQGLITHMMVSLLADPNPAPPPDAPSAVGTAPSELAAVLQLLAERLTTPPPPAPDPMAQFGAMLALAGQMREAFGLNGQASAPAPKTLLEQMAELRALREVAVELAPPTPDADDDMGKLMTLGGQVVGMVKDAMQRPEPAPAGLAPVTLPPTLAFTPRPAVPQAPEPSRWPPLSDDANAPSTTATQQENPVSQVATEPNPANHLQTLLAQAVVMAQTGMHPELGAQLLIGSDDRPGLPDEMLDMIERDDWWTVLTSVPELAAALTPHEVWVCQVRAIMIGWLAEDDVVDDNRPSDHPADLSAANAEAAIREREHK